MEGITLTPLKIIPSADGSVMHALKNFEDSYVAFGEAYFSSVKHNVVKGWKKHQEMISNLIVPVGKIKFIFFDDRAESSTYQQFHEVELSPENYQRLTVQPGIWMAFKGEGKGLNLLLNISSIPHDPKECETLNIKNALINYSF
jgi:dTDP-4-dehydrorhamnose 3,5-epimerase